ncbi:DNA polymerase V family protein [Brevibacillus porteri]|uniref:DNA polymerase V family protein n=1 Tax=Brevibacillus porteri TaxID=2126350 RepID=UPI001FC92722|nr:DNA polymerase V family protein [Brevibacillus porteri]MED1801333.1 DNA polymerase V family protein [Brevibacillus porteri]MED2135040.1 DNA polymerase V family protein [Brevibacillus porteri]MED2745137.1 DNA polymerase V family protein [Brevibacillus porteri]MED2813431.1 DNA polymerase V family protein [Brevibacillus porteri]MED2897956.1 DNA polymerase V family protein [Brevibacillus porteri]
MSKHAQFTAIVKKMASNDKKIVVNLEMVGKPDPYDLADIVDMVGDKVVVRLGNPQMAMNFDEDEREERRGLSVTTDQSGVVTQVNGDAEEDKKDTGDLENDENESEEFERDEQAGEEGNESSEDWEGSEGNPEIQAEDKENDNTPDPEPQGQEESADNTNDSDQEEDTQDDAVAAIDKDKLVAFILSGQAPSFEETEEYDFPALLARKQNGETWIKIASSIGTSASKLQTA